MAGVGIKSSLGIIHVLFFVAANLLAIPVFLIRFIYRLDRQSLNIKDHYWPLVVITKGKEDLSFIIVIIQNVILVSLNFHYLAAH